MAVGLVFAAICLMLVSQPVVQAQSACPTLLDTAAANPDLSLLTIAASVAGVESVIGEVQGSTVFLPNNAALTTFLATYSPNGDPSALLGMAPQLQAVLAYHISPGEALSESQLLSEVDLPTELQGYYLNFAKTANGVEVKTPVNTANIVSSEMSCTNQVYIIDSVLLPVASLMDIPLEANLLGTSGYAAGGPGPAPAPAPAPL